MGLFAEKNTNFKYEHFLSVFMGQFVRYGRKRKKKRKTWVQKMNAYKDLPKIQEMKGKMAEVHGNGKILLPAPKDIYEIMKSIPEGKIITIAEIGEILKERFKVDVVDLVRLGLFAKICAHASQEIRKEDHSEFFPFWRTLKNDGSLNPNYPGGLEVQKRLLEREGHNVVKKATKFVVQDFEETMFEPGEY